MTSIPVNKSKKFIADLFIIMCLAEYLWVLSCWFFRWAFRLKKLTLNNVVAGVLFKREKVVEILFYFFITMVYEACLTATLLEGVLSWFIKIQIQVNVGLLSILTDLSISKIRFCCFHLFINNFSHQVQFLFYDIIFRQILICMLESVN